MRGAQELVAARLKGFMPGLVFVDLDLPPIRIRAGHIQIDPSDRLSSLDLRCIHGLAVAVSGVDLTKTRAIAGACAEAGATRVIATIHQDLGGGNLRAIEVTDTKGSMTWKA